MGRRKMGRGEKLAEDKNGQENTGLIFGERGTWK